nr:AEC family transporter [Fructilactobacillus florum]
MLVNITQLANQIIILFGLMFVGFLIGRLNLMKPQTSRDLTSILIEIVSPCLIIVAFQAPYSASRLRQFFLAFVAVIILYGAEMIISHALFCKVGNANLRLIAQYGSIFSNAGFMGIPLIQALFGPVGVFYAVVALAAFNLFNWTYGVAMFQPADHLHPGIDWRQVCLNPNNLAILLGLVFFFLQIKITGPLGSVLGYVSSLNTPLAMLVIGNSLAHVKLHRTLFNWSLGLSLLLRNLLYPLLALGLFRLVGLSGTALNTSVVMAACPVAGLVVLFSLQARHDPAPAIALMSCSTILCLVTIPLVFFINNFII